MKNAKLISVSFILAAAVSGAALKAFGAPPNIEGLMPFVISLGLLLGPVYGFVSALLIRGAYDGYIGWAGPWTILTSLSYGVVGLCVGFVGKWKAKWSRLELALLAAGLTLVYDVITMFAFGFMFRMPLQALVMGQVPFTINHVLGNVLFVVVFAPMLLKAAASVSQEQFDVRRVFSVFRV